MPGRAGAGGRMPDSESPGCLPVWALSTLELAKEVQDVLKYNIVA